MQSCVPKVAELRTRFPTKDIQVDGGVGPGTVGCCARAGASRCSSRPCASCAPRARSRGLALPAQPHLRLLALASHAGSNVIVAGTALFGADKPAEVITDFKRQIDDSKSKWGTEAALDSK